MVRLTYKVTFDKSLSCFLTYITVLISLFLVFFSYNKASLGVECIFLTVLILFLNFKNKYVKEMTPFILMFCFTTIMFLVSGQTGVRGFNAPVNHMLKFVYLMFTVALSIGMRELSKKNRLKVIQLALFSALISSCISSYFAIFINKYAIRYPDTYGFTNIVDFSQFYGICLILCAIFFVLLQYRKQYPIWKHLLYSLPLVICVGVSLYVTGVLITAIGVGLGYVVHKYTHSKTRVVLGAFFIIFVILLVFIFRVELSDYIYKITEPLNWILKDRLRSVADTLLRTNHNLEYSYDRRNELAGYSLTTFLKYPIFGVGYKEYGYGIIGGHQEWQDMLGVFGITGTLFFIYSMIYFVRITAKNIDNKTDLLSFYISVVLFVILGFLNPCLNLPVLTAVFVIAPNVSLIIPWWKRS